MTSIMHLTIGMRYIQYSQMTKDTLTETLLIRLSPDQKQRLVEGAARMTLKRRKRVTVGELLRESALKEVDRMTPVKSAKEIGA